MYNLEGCCEKIEDNRSCDNCKNLEYVSQGHCCKYINLLVECWDCESKVRHKDYQEMEYKDFCCNYYIKEVD